MRIVMLGGVAGPVLFSLITIVSAQLRPDYSHVRNFISELGADGTSKAALMNYAGFVPAGVMLAAFGLALSTTLPRDRFRVPVSVLVTIFGVGMAASGILSCDPGCPQTGGSVENIIHNGIAPVAFLSAITAAAIVGVRLRHVPTWRAVARYSLLASVLAVGFLAALAGSLEARQITGVWQRLLVGTLFSWCAAVGLKAFASSASRSATPT